MRLLFVAAVLVALAGCYQKHDVPGDAPTNVKATAGDGVVLMTWDVLPDLTYWIFFKPGLTVSPTEPGSTAIRRAFEPRIVAGLANEIDYAFVMNATNNGSKAGPASPVVTARPRLAGDTWVSGAALPTTLPNLNSVAFAGTRFVAVGDAGTILAGDFDYPSDSPPGVISWVPPTTPTTPITSSNIVSVLWNGVSAFDALASDGTTFTSPDGLNWTQQGTVPATGMNSLTFAFQVTTPTFIAVGNGGSIFISSDLKTWTQAVSNTTADLTNIQVHNGFFMATGTNGTLVISGDGGANWFVQTTGTTATLRGTAFAAFLTTVTTMYVAVGDGGVAVTAPIVNNPPVNVTWTASVIPGAPNLRSVTVGGASGSRFLAVGLGGAVAYSDDGVSWSPPKTTPPVGDFSSVLYTTPMYMAVGAAGATAISR